MSLIQKGLLPLGNNYSLKAFVEEGGYVHRKPISEYDPLSIVGMVANKEYTWDFSNIDHDIIPLILYGTKSTGINNNDSLILRVRQSSTNQVIWQIEIAGKKTTYGNTFEFTFPFSVISRLHKASISSSVALDSLIIFCEKAFLNSVIAPESVV